MSNPEGVVSSKYKRGWLEAQYLDAVDADQALLVRLQTLLRAASASIANGQAIMSTSGNGRAVAFSRPGEGAPGPAGEIELIEEMLRRFRRASKELIDEGNPTPTDELIHERMQAGIVAVRFILNDWTRMIK